MSKRLSVFTCTDHRGHWPVGVASVVVASDEAQARRLLDQELKRRGLAPALNERYTLQRVDLEAPAALVLHDGDY